jgi:hypothetical protein
MSKEKTQFKSGAEWNGNKNGRPKGSPTLTTMVREALKKIALSEGGVDISYEELLVRRILKKAIEEGDGSMINLLWSYMDGRPVERKALTDSDGEDLFQPTERVKELARALYEIQRGGNHRGDGISTVPVVYTEQHQDESGDAV